MCYQSCTILCSFGSFKQCFRTTRHFPGTFCFSLIVHDWKTVSLFSRFSTTLSLLPTEAGEGKTVETCKCNVHFQSIQLKNIRNRPAEPPEEPEHAPTGSLCFYGLVLTLAAERVGCCRLGSEPQCSVVFTLLSNCLISQQ